MGKPRIMSNFLTIFSPIFLLLAVAGDALCDTPPSTGRFVYEATPNPMGARSSLSGDGKVFTSAGSARISVWRRSTNTKLFEICCFAPGSSLYTRHFILGEYENFGIAIIKNDDIGVVTFTGYGPDGSSDFEAKVGANFEELNYSLNRRKDRLYFWDSNNLWAYSKGAKTLKVYTTPWEDYSPDNVAFGENDSVVAYNDGSNGFIKQQDKNGKVYGRVCENLIASTRQYLSLDGSSNELLALDEFGNSCYLKDGEEVFRTLDIGSNLRDILLINNNIFILTGKSLAVYSKPDLNPISRITIDEIIEDIGIKKDRMYGFHSIGYDHTRDRFFVIGNGSTGMFFSVTYEE
jgi:hypothetical protein